MARPRFNPTNAHLTRSVLGQVQSNRLATLSQFAKIISTAAVAENVQEDDHLFARIVSISIEDYGVKQSALAAKMKVSTAAVSRWATLKNLPTPTLRPVILRAIIGLIEQSVRYQTDTMQNDMDAVGFGRAIAGE